MAHGIYQPFSTYPGATKPDKPENLEETWRRLQASCLSLAMSPESLKENSTGFRETNNNAADKRLGIIHSLLIIEGSKGLVSKLALDTHSSLLL
ncbi:hypothetical protein BDW68DRAFT_158134 [Aspergillus falconensis]